MDHRWYAIQVTAGHENKVRQLIQRKIETDPKPASDRQIRQALVPTQEVVVIKNGKKVPVEQKLPQPLRAEEVNRLLGIADKDEEQEPQEEIPFLIGQAVEITEGPFTEFSGTVEDIMPDKGKVRVTVSLFGRPTSVELDYLQLRAY